MTPEAASSNDLSSSTGASGADGFDIIEGLEFDVDDWISWDQLLKDQSQLGNQQ
jgi:hypothetical protein